MTRRRSKKRSIFIDLIDWLTDYGLKLGGVAFVLVLGYLIWGLAAKNGLLRLDQLPRADQDRVIANVALACKILGISGIVVAFTVTVRYYVEETLGYIMSLLGVLLYFAIPWLFSNWFTNAGPAAGYAIAIIVSEIRLVGMAFFAAGVVLVIRDIVLRARLAMIKSEKKLGPGGFVVGEQTEDTSEPYRPRLYAKCWQTPYCRDFVKTTCPAYEARKSCWRRKSGCMCDPAVIERALRARTTEGRMFMRELQYRLGDVPQKKTELTAAEKRQRCRNCVIYEFHQKQKYRLLSPLVFPIVGILLWLLYPGIKAIFQAVVEMTDKFMQSVTFMPKAESNVPVGTAVPEVVLIFLVVWLALIAISYGLLFVEFCVFKMKI